MTRHRCGFVVWHLRSWDHNNVTSLVYIGVKKLILRMLDVREEKNCQSQKRNAYDTCWKI